MKQTLLTRLVLGAIAGIAAAGVANAGQIQASSVSIAREAITVDTQTVVAPSIAYRFAGDVDARVQSQTFQVQFTLAAGEWAAAPTAGALSVSDGVSGTIINQQAATDGAYTVDQIALSADKKTVFATVTVFKGAAGILIKQPIVSLNVTSNTIGGVAATNVAAQRGTVTKLFSVVGDIVNDYNTTGACEGVKTLAVSFKHYVALTSPASLATDATATADEHTRGGATNAATLMTFPTNVKVVVSPSTSAAILTPGGNTTFSNSGAGGTSWVDGNTVMLGAVSLVQNAMGYDSNLANQYVLAGVATGSSAAGLDAQTTAGAIVGDVEVNTVTAVVSATQGFVVGGTLYASTTPNCGTLVAGSTTAAFTAATSAGPATVTIPNAAVNAAFGPAGTAPVYICYDAPGANTIPSSAFSAVGRVNKAAAGANLNEQDNVCNGSFYSLGGGLKIDLRNYASSKETSGYSSVVRFINNSDVRTADVWAQIIHQDGKLGGWGKLADLAPRAVLNMTAAQIEAKLTNAPTAAVGTTVAAASADGAPRLRVTSNSGSTLRVQNYLFNSATGQILEASNAQGVDFEIPNTNRAPASEGQYQIQDANSGLNLQ